MDKLTMMVTFKNVVDTGSFTAAGKHIHKSKALLSKQVKDLEEYLGCRLLNRSTRRLYVTDFGKAYYKHCTNKNSESKLGVKNSGSGLYFCIESWIILATVE
jgi:oligoribonuclease (3'-5' exoribonuclease)